MTTDKSGSKDKVAVALNEEPVDDTLAPEDFDQSHLEDCKGPDPDHWDDPDARDEPDFDEGDPDAVRVDNAVLTQDPETGEVIVESGDEVTHVKGPGPEWA